MLIAHDGLTEALHNRIDVLFALGRLTDEQYRTLVDGEAQETA